MKNWLKHLFVHDWVLEYEYLSPRPYVDGFWIAYNRIMVCKRCGKLKHYSIKIASCGRMPIAHCHNCMQCRSCMESIKEQMKAQGYFKNEV